MSQHYNGNQALLLDMAHRGRVVADTARHRRLWYHGLTQWVSPTEMALSDSGARVVNRLLYGKG